MIKFYRYLFYINYRIGYNYYTSKGSSKTPEFQAVLNLFTFTNAYIITSFLLINKNVFHDYFQIDNKYYLISVIIALSLYFVFHQFEKKTKLYKIIKEFKEYDEKHKMQGKIIWLLYNYILWVILFIFVLL